MGAHITVWQAREVAAFLAGHDRQRRPNDDTLSTAHAQLVNLAEDGGEPVERGYVLGVLTEDGAWRAFWGDGSDVTAEYPQPATLA